MLTATPRGRRLTLYLRLAKGVNARFNGAKRMGLDIMLSNTRGENLELPRKYRPPAKRNKNRTTNIPYQTGTADESNTWASDPVVDASAGTVAVDESRSEPVAGSSTREAGLPRERHVTRDYGYVRGEVARIAVIATFLIVALIIISILRN